MHLKSKKHFFRGFLLGLFGIGISLNVAAQKFDKFFPKKDLTTVGVYYYPEHWDQSQKWVLNLLILENLPGRS